MELFLQELAKLGDRFYLAFVAADRWKLYLSGLGNTLAITLGAICISTVLGMLLCLMKISRYRILRGPAKAYIDVIRGIPVVVHEQNSVMGMANKYLAKRAAAVCLTYEHAAEALADKSRVRVTGNPVRESVFSATREQGRARFGVPEGARMLLVTGGSLGARHLNQAVAALKDELLAYGDLHIVQVTGPKELDAVREQLALSPEQQARWQLLGYTDHMGDAMAAADVVVSRAGATSLAEISARALPALLVPFPFATEDHQTMNAQACVEAGAAYLVADADVEGPEFARKLRELIEDEDVRARMAAAARAQKTRDAAGLLADAVMEAARAQR